MRVLFVSSGRQGDVGFVVRNQGESLSRHAINVEYFTIDPGISGYLKAITRLRRLSKFRHFDIVHAHYSFSAFTATLSGCQPLIVSLMGSDTYHNRFVTALIKHLSLTRWAATIVKTIDMKTRLNLSNALVIPNGVDIERFKPMDKKEARNYLNQGYDKWIVLFVAGRNRKEKRLSLAIEAIRMLNCNNVDFIHLNNTPNEQIPFYLNSADLLLLTSSREGSVNIVKEAMACNCPVVSTDVGDVSWVIGTTEYCYVTPSSPSEIARNIKKALDASKRTNGRERLIEIGLDSGSVAERIINVYRQVLNRVQNDSTVK